MPTIHIHGSVIITREMIEKCKVYRPEDAAGCHLYVDQIFYVSREDGFLYRRLDQVTASCIEKYPDTEIDTQRACIRETRKIIWNKYIDGIFKVKKPQ